jgi:4-amino-4-deoxy-L-arabinose transferase-like glycosyltransferase
MLKDFLIASFSNWLLYNKYMKKYLLIIILVLATFLRLYKLSINPPSMFGDEADLGYQAYSILKTGKDYQGNFMPLNFHSLAEYRTPLYLYSAVPTVAIFGVSPLGVRLPAAIYGVLSVLGFYLLVSKMSNGNWKMASIASFLLAISPWHLQYSRAGFVIRILCVKNVVLR